MPATAASDEKTPSMLSIGENWKRREVMGKLLYKGAKEVRRANGTIVLRVGPEMHNWLLDEAAKYRVSMNQIIKELIETQMKEKQNDHD